MRGRLVFLLVDGMGDVSLPQLHNMTPLQVADTPIFDAVVGIASTGRPSRTLLV
jgi:2,3-bisphosphoglycerate-independent phosphoglycerate mutase